MVVGGRGRFGAIMVLGKFKGFHQAYPTFGITTYTSGWSLIWGDYSELLHAVWAGSGFRFSITLFNHHSISTDTRLRDGAIVDWWRFRPPAPEQWVPPDLTALIKAREDAELQRGG